MDALRRQLSAAEEALRNLEPLYRLLGDNAPFGILAADTTGRIIGSNRKIQERLPWPADQDRASIELIAIKPLVKAGFVKEFQQCIQMKYPIISQPTCHTQHEGNCHLRFYFSPVTDELGTVVEALLSREV